MATWESMRISMNRCALCGHETSSSSVCNFCPAKVASDPAPMSATAPTVTARKLDLAFEIRALAGLGVLVGTFGACFVFCADRDEPPSDSAKATPAPAEALPHAPGVARQRTCELVARKFIKKMWTCGLNAEGFTEEQLCSTIDTSTLMYMESLETCNEFLVRSGIAK